MNALKELNMKFLLSRCLLPLLALFVTAGAFAQQARLQVEGAWIRASASPTGTGAFMRLTAAEPLTLVGVRSPVAGVAEVHEMKLDGDVMRMRALDTLALPAGKTVELKPGGLHLMLMDLKAPLQGDIRVPVTLVLRDAQGAERRLDLQVPVAARAPASAGHSGGQPMPAHQHRH